MGRAPCCDKANVKKGPWSPEEDAKLKEFIDKYGPAANWIALPQKAGLKRCGKSCRLRWLNYLRPNIKHGEFSDEEDKIICTLYSSIGSRWSIIASQLPGRTDNDIKNYWNTKLKKKILGINILSSNQPKFPPPFSFPLHTSIPQSQSLSNLSNLYTSYDQARKSLSSAAAAVNLSAQNILYSNTHLLTAGQHETGLADFHDGYYPMNDNMLVFGANEAAAAASSSSSYGSCSHISYGGGKDHRVKNEEEIGVFQGFFENRNAFVLEDQLGSILDHHHKQRNGVFENSQLQFDLEEVNQLITAGGLVWGDENKLGGEMGFW